MSTSRTRMIIVASLVVATFFGSVANAAIVEPGFEKETVTGGFVLPVAMAFAPDGRIFVAEKGGTVRVVKDGALLATPLISLTDVNTFGDRGLLGIAVDPNFSTNGYLYLSYTYENTPGANVGGEKTGRIVRVTVIGDTALESSKVVIVGTVGGNAAMPSCEDVAITADCIPSDSPSHSVGGLRFGPDGKLYATLGDGAHFDYADPRSLRAQNIDSLAGKLLRINADGTAPADNPFYNGDANANRSKVYALGLRNAFRLNFNPMTGKLYTGDVGWSSFEEVNEMIAGGNYGWPCIEGTTNTSHACTPSSTSTDPLYAYAHNASGAGSVIVGAFGANNVYPDQYDTSLFLGDYAQNWIKRVVLDASGAVSSVEMFDDSPDGPVDLSTGIDGNIYYLSIYTGELNRLTHTTGNRRPIAVASAVPTSGLLPLNVSFSSVGSNDPDGDAMTYAWNFGDGTTSNLENPSHTYTVAGTYSAVLTLTDIHGAVATKSVTIIAGNQAPVASITHPSSGSLYVVNQTINLVGDANDFEDGVLPASAYHWTIILHHNTHIHIEQEFTGTKTPSFTAPDHSSSDVYVEVLLEVTDSAGLVGESSINLYLNNGSGAGNLIANPSLEVANETSGQPLSWHQGWFGSLTPVFTYPVAGFEGAKAAMIEVSNHTSGNAKWYFDPVFVTPGAQYAFSNKYISTVPNDLFAQFGLSNGTYQYAYLGTVPATATPTPTNFVITIPENVQTMTVFHEMLMNGSLTVDDYSLTLAPDTTPPVVSISSPANSDVLSGTTTIDVTVTDAGGVAGVTLVIDGTDVLPEDTTFPYSFEWVTTEAINGAHTVTVRARDTAGNVSTATPISVSVLNTNNLILNGDFEIENGADPLNWIRGGWGNHTREHTYPVLGHDGNKAVRLEITDYPDPPVGTGDAKWVFNAVQVTPGAEYTYKDWYRSSTISDIIGRYTLEGGAYHYFGLAKEIQPTTAWANITATFTPPVTATHVTFFHLISAEGFLELDDVEMYVTGSGGSSETNAPIVEFTNPLEGQTVSGIVPITASSTDDTAVTYIFYAVDGIPVTGQITTAPYLFNWDSSTVSDGAHFLKATTHDPFGNNSTHTIIVNVDNSAPPLPSNNLILDPYMESIDVPVQTDWLKGGWGTNDRTFSAVSTGKAAIGGKVEITNYTSGDAKWYFKDVAVTPGETYTFSNYYISNVSTELLARITLANGSAQYMFLESLPATGAEGAYTLEEIVIPANAVSLTVFHILHSNGSLTVDTYKLYAGGLVPDTSVPTVAITAPLSGTSFDESFSVEMQIEENIAIESVGLLVDGILFAEDSSTQPGSAAEDTLRSFPVFVSLLSAGDHTISAFARDVAGNTSTSTPVTVTITSSTPPVSNLILNASLENSGAGGDPEHWFRGGWGTNTRTFTYPVSGSHGVSAARVDITAYSSGDAKWYFAEVPVTPGTTYNLTNDYKSTASTEVLVRYTLAGGAQQYGFLGTRPAAANWTQSAFSITPPVNTVSLTVFHVLHSVGSLEIDNFALSTPSEDTVAPTISLTAPANGATITGATTITGTASDDVGVIGVTMILDGVVTGAEDTTAPYEFLWDSATVTNGTHTLALRARDAAGNVATSSVISVTVSNSVTPPLTSLISNPSVETPGTGGSPLDWSPAGWGTNTRIFTYPVAGIDGVSALRVEMSAFTDGDAKWRHNDVPVTAGDTYTITHQYRSNVTTNLTARFTLANGTYYYLGLGNLAPQAGWSSHTQTFVVPENAVSLTVMHIINAVGFVETDSYELVEGNGNEFANGMISLTFDDGWISHYTAALPILDAANVDGTFFITSQETLNAVPQELVFNPSLEDIDLLDEGYPTQWHPGGWGTNDRFFEYPVPGENGGSAARVTMTTYTDGDAKWWFEDVAVIPGQTYRFEDSYLSTATTELILQITLADDTVQHMYLGAVPSSGGVWARYSHDVALPTNARLVSLFHIIASPGSLTIDNMSVKRVPDFVNVSQMLAMQASGHEIGGHTRTHANLTTISDAEAQFEIEGSRSDILGAGVTTVNTFAYPFGAYDADVQTMMTNAGFIASRGVERGFNTRATDKLALKIQSMNRTTTLAEVQGWINQAIAENTWLILMFHQIDDDLSQTLGVTPEFLEQTVGEVIAAGIEVVSLEEGVSRMNP